EPPQGVLLLRRLRRARQQGVRLPPQAEDGEHLLLPRGPHPPRTHGHGAVRRRTGLLAPVAPQPHPFPFPLRCPRGADGPPVRPLSDAGLSPRVLASSGPYARCPAPSPPPPPPPARPPSPPPAPRNACEPTPARPVGFRPWRPLDQRSRGRRRTTSRLPFTT